ncbi:MAG TPA: TetR/AcrR family transcriptional regulator, partial [Phnomibacter sp.]|nr:TetR/AcrR family transcriptional regulator [Phnomibacter sp.]
KGYHATSMRMLAEALDMEAASLYNHISSKEELLRTICFDLAEAYLQHMEGLEKQQLSPIDCIKELLTFHAGMMMDCFDAVYVTNRDFKHLPPPYLEQFLQQRRHYERRMETIIEAGMACGQIRKVHPRVAVLTLLGAMRSIEFWQRNPRGISARQMTNDLITLLLHGAAQ